ACSTTGLKGQMAILGGTYALSKRTAFFAYGTHMRNGRSSNYSNLTRQNTNPAGGSAVVAGQDMTQLVVGIDHSF
ncbi:MAG: putative porin protein, partial [Noviherbaspirillum sp.]|nr:putative porin protein [Noviherbaspirillum sp.]